MEQAFLVPSVQTLVTSAVQVSCAARATGRPTTATPQMYPSGCDIPMAKIPPREGL